VRSVHLEKEIEACLPQTVGTVIEVCNLGEGRVELVAAGVVVPRSFQFAEGIVVAAAATFVGAVDIAEEDIALEGAAAGMSKSV